MVAQPHVVEAGHRDECELGEGHMRYIAGVLPHQDGPLAAATVGWLLLGGLLVVAVAAAAFRVVPENGRTVVFRFGRAVAVKGPGLVFVVPLVDRTVPVSLQTTCHDLLALDASTRDDVTVRVRAVVVESVRDPLRFATAADAPLSATTAIAESVVRRSIARHRLVELPSLLASSDDDDSLARINEVTETWGVHVSLVRITHVDVPLTAGLLGKAAGPVPARRRPGMTARGS